MIRLISWLTVGTATVLSLSTKAFGHLPWEWSAAACTLALAHSPQRTPAGWIYAALTAAAGLLAVSGAIPDANLPGLFLYATVVAINAAARLSLAGGMAWVAASTVVSLSAFRQWGIPMEQDWLILNAVNWLLIFLFTRGMLAGRRSVVALNDELQRQAGALQRSMDLSLDMIVTIALDGRYLSVSRAARTILGYEPNEMVNRQFESFVHPDDVIACVRKSAELLRDRSMSQFQARHMTRDGRVVWLEWTAVALPAEGCIYAIARDVTARREQAARIQESEQRYRSLFDYNPEAAFSLDLEGRLVAMNAAGERLAGARLEDMVGKSFLLFVPPEEQAAMLRGLRAAAGGEPQQSEVSIVNQSGEIRRVSATASPIVVDGAVVGIFGVAKDITEQRRVERAFRDQERLYRLLAENSRDLIVLRGPQGEAQFISPAVEQILGYTACEYAAMPNADLIHPDDLPQVLRVRAEALSGKVADFTYRVSHKNGHLVWLEALIRPILDEQGNPVGTLTTARDVTERVRMEQQVQESEQRYRSLFEHNEDMVAVFDLHGNLLDANPRTEQLTGYPKAAFRGLLFQAHLSRGHADSLGDHRERVRRGELDTYEAVIPHRDGHGMLFRITMVPVAAGGESHGYFCVARDITESRRREQRLRFLEKAGAVLASTLDYQATLSAVAELAVEELADCCSVDMLQDDGQVRPVAVAHPCQSGDGEVVPWTCSKLEGAPDDLHPVGRVIRSGRSLLVSDVRGASSQPVDGNQEYRQPCAALGVSSYIVVPVRTHGRVMGAISLCQVQSKLRFGEADRAAAEELARMVGLAVDNSLLYKRAQWAALHDPLTELPNRTLLSAHMESAFAVPDRGVGGTFAVLFLDLDNFKVVNDSLGHHAGDELLRAVAARISECLMPGEMVARFGGDEFVILLEKATLAEAESAAGRILQGFRAPFDLHFDTVNVSASIGIVLSTACRDPGDMVRRADIAMYQAKRQGRARYSVFDAALDAAAVERLQLEMDMRQALKRQEFELEYQPIVDLQTGETVMLEALVRWRHPKRGRLMPGAFIELAEESGAIIELGRWVLFQACRQARQWQADFGLPRLGISVNLSPRQFQDPELLAAVSAVLRETGLPPHSLELEITESLLMQDDAATLDTVHALLNLGAHLALDDFGTGYSALNYLKRFPLHTVKIDRSFTEGLDGSTKDAAVVGAVVMVAKALGMQVTAEGVETATQWDRLRVLGCDRGQGYHFARPLSVAAVESMLGGED
jgi:diguanylate cyclase (GGDEF)-like protein/PAS domain S-box-containing protein